MNSGRRKVGQVSLSATSRRGISESGIIGSHWVIFSHLDVSADNLRRFEAKTRIHIVDNEGIPVLWCRVDQAEDEGALA